MDEAFDGAEATHALFAEEYGRDSLDGSGMKLVSTVHYGEEYDNAFWNGQQMAYGDGAVVFKPLTGSLAVIGHELSHGVVQFSGGLVYRDQSGALNESFADVSGLWWSSASPTRPRRRGTGSSAAVCYSTGSPAKPSAA